MVLLLILLPSGLRDKVGAAISEGIMENPVIRSHGGRARAIATDDIHIDVAFWEHQVQMPMVTLTELEENNLWFTWLCYD